LENDDRRVALVRLGLFAAAAEAVVLHGWISLTFLLLPVFIPFLYEPKYLPAAIACQLLLLTGMYAVVAAASRAKSLVVYLRRFGRSDANAVVEAALRKTLGSRYRVITLDDSQFVPLPMLARSRLAIGLPPMLGCAFLALVAIVAFIAITNFAPTITGFIWLPILMSFFIAAPMIAGVLTMGPAMAISGTIHMFRVRRRRTLIVRTPDDLDAAAAIVARLKSWWRRPSLADVHSMTIKTADEIWQPAVRRFLAMADLVLFDVSERTANLEWELARVSEECPGRVVYITGNRETETDDTVSYAEPGRRAQAAFRSSLRRRLAGVLGGAGRRSVAKEKTLSWAPIVYLLILALLDVAVIVAWPMVVRWVQSHG